MLAFSSHLIFVQPWSARAKTLARQHKVHKQFLRQLAGVNDECVRRGIVNRTAALLLLRSTSPLHLQQGLFTYTYRIQPTPTVGDKQSRTFLRSASIAAKSQL